MRHTAGDGDLATELVAVMLAPGAHSPAGQKLPAAVSLIPVRMGRGLPAPIALGLPRGHLPARLPFRPDRSSPPAGHSAMKPSAKRSPKVAAADHRQRRRAHRARAALLDCQRLTAVQAPSDRSRFQRTQAYSQNRCSRSPRTRSTSVATPSARACNATRAAIRTSARGRQRTTRPGREAATRARAPLQAQRQVSRRAIRHERGSTHGAPHGCSSQSCIGKRTRLFAPPEGRSLLVLCEKERRPARELTSRFTNIRHSWPLRNGRARLLLLTGSSSRSTDLLSLVDEHLYGDSNGLPLRGAGYPFESGRPMAAAFSRQGRWTAGTMATRPGRGGTADRRPVEVGLTTRLR